MNAYEFGNNVYSQLAVAINDTATTIEVLDAAAPYKDFPNPVNGGIAIATLTDNRFNPTKLEIISYTGITDAGGNHQLTGVTRGIEGTTAQSWGIGDHVYQAITANALENARFENIQVTDAQFAAGSAVAPSIGFADNKGFFQPAAGYVGLNASLLMGLSLPATPDGTLHIHSGTAGNVAAHGNGNEFVVEGAGITGISILSPDGSPSVAYFGSPSDSIGAQLNWKFNDLRFIVGSATAGGELDLRSGQNVSALALDSSQNAIFSGQLRAINGSSSAPSYGFANGTDAGMYFDAGTGDLHLRPVSQSADVIHLHAEDIFIGESELWLNQSGSQQKFVLGTLTSFHFSDSVQVNGYIAIDDAMTAPSAITSMAAIYVDSADGDLKVKFADGTVKLLAADT